MSTNKIKAFIFDFGNVLSLAPPADLMKGMADYLDAEEEAFSNAYYKWRNHYDDGTYSQHQYWEAVAETLGSQISQSHSKALFDLDYNMWFREPNRDTCAWVSYLRDHGYRVALLSNMPGDHQRHLDIHCDWFPTFHHRTFSGPLKCAKPNPEIYHHTLDGLGVKADETVFIDDNTDNIAAARALGLHSIHFKNAQQAAAEIKTAHSIDLPLQNFEE